MKLSGNTILITGGSTGIGLAFAERFMKAGNTVIVCGRRESALQDAEEKVHGLITRVCDLDMESERLALFDWVTANYPEVNVLVNNAGIQLRYNVLKADARDHWNDFRKEITTNIEAPFHLSMLFAPFLRQKKRRRSLTSHPGWLLHRLRLPPFIQQAKRRFIHSP